MAQKKLSIRQSGFSLAINKTEASYVLGVDDPFNADRTVQVRCEIVNGKKAIVITKD
ncbi:hypothetical protein [Methanococcus maripaludis]|uniref:Uncharacterized protein n=1 Tax=Methanococcus maripaludis TaxID=39152 RepID=A0A7J9PMI6_METMI|nr:hypothetical protein [Methanococcus maripaludis]MBA2864425.1 hypothetical protein [Methanococcus maripaludis]